MTYAALAKLKKNSVPTYITSGITASDTTIPVAETSVFYDSDGVLITKGIVIGYDNITATVSEEITITGCTTTSGVGSLTGATRGVNVDGTIGQAAIWSSATNIAVMFSTGIYNQIKDNLIAHESGKASTAAASTSAAGLAPQATAPGAGLRNVLGIDNGATAYTNKALFDATNPAMNGTASPGTEMAAARRDHIHASDTSRAPVDSPTFTTAANSVTPAVDDNDTSIATTAFVMTQLGRLAVPTTGLVTGQTMAITDGDADTFGQVAYVKLNSGATKAYKALATNAATTTPAIALFSASGRYLMCGLACSSGWSWTVGSPLYVDASTAGAMTQTAPSGTGKIVQIVGWAMSATVIYFNPSNTWIELS